MSGLINTIKEKVPGTTEHKVAQATGGSAAGTGYNSSSTVGGVGDGYGSTTSGGAAYGSGAAAPDYSGTGVGSGVGATGEHHHGHHHGGHHHGHHGHTGTGVTGSTVDTPHEKTTEKIAKVIPGTDANKEHKANTEGGYGGASAGTGYASNDNLGSAGATYGSSGATPGLTGSGAGAGYGATAGHGATGAGFGTVDTSRETTAQGVAKHVPGTDAHKEHAANTTTGSYGASTATGTTGSGYGTTGSSAVGGNTTVGTAHETTKDKLLKIIPGTEQHKEKKAQKEAGL